MNNGNVNPKKVNLNQAQLEYNIEENGVFLVENELCSTVTLNILNDVTLAVFLAPKHDLNIEVNVSENVKFDLYVNTNTLNDLNIAYKANVLANSEHTLFIQDLSSYSTNYALTQDLRGVNSSANIYTTSIASKNSMVRFDSRINHYAQYSSSDNYNRSVVLEGGESAFKTIGFIEKTMSHSKCFQDSKVLLLDDQAQASCDPVLLIDEFDVEAGHAAAVGQVNQDELYYLQSRGLSKEECVSLLVHGFLISVLEKISLVDIREAFQNQINSHLQRI